jgi:hypothetical protein
MDGLGGRRHRHRDVVAQAVGIVVIRRDRRAVFVKLLISLTSAAATGGNKRV